MDKPKGMTERDYFFHEWLIIEKGIKTEEQYKEISKPESWLKLNKEFDEFMKTATVISV